MGFGRRFNGPNLTGPNRSPRWRPTAYASLGFLICPWKEIDPDSLPGAFSFLFDQLRDDALDAARSDVYEWVTGQASELLSVLAFFDAEQAGALGGTWPAPSSSMGRRVWDQYRYFWDRILARSLVQIAQFDVDRALELDRQQDFGLRAEARGAIAVGLWNSGRHEEALDVANQVILDFRNTRVDSQVAADFSAFVWELFPFALRPLHKELYRKAWTVSVEKGDGLQEPHSILKAVDGASVGFSSTEVMGLYQLAYLEEWPGGTRMSKDLLKRFPELEKRVERIGGVLGFLSQKTYHGPRHKRSYRPPRRPGKIEVRPPSLPGHWTGSIDRSYP